MGNTQRFVRPTLAFLCIGVLAMLMGRLAARYSAEAPADRRQDLAALLDLARYEQPGLNAYAAAIERTLSQADGGLYAVPPVTDVSPPTAAEAHMIAQTAQRYYDVFGLGDFDHFIGAGIETGNPIPKNLGRQWNSLKDSGLYDPVFRQAFIRKMHALGIRNLRLGLSNHDIFKVAGGIDGPWDDSSWRQMDEIISDLAAGGLKLSLDLHHFGIERIFQVAATPRDPSTDFIRDGVNYSRSFYLHPKWPAYFAEFAGEAFRRYHNKVVAFTLINEPETTNGFQSQMWNGGQPGWFSPEHAKLYIERGIRIGLAAVLARTRMEELNAALPAAERKPLLFIQSEAAQYKADDEQFTTYSRYMTLDMILGHRWLIDADLKALESDSLEDLDARWSARTKAPKSMLEWLIHRYVFRYSKENREQRRKYLLAQLETLQQAHRMFATKFGGMTMQSFTVLGIDYYAQNESRNAATKLREQRQAGSVGNTDQWDVQELDSEPQSYAAQLRAGERIGFYGVALAYWGRYRTMPLASTENGTAWWEQMSLWHTQQLLEEGLIQQRHHIPFLGHFLYPLIDVRGWEDNCALSLEPTDADFGPTGLIDHDLVSRPPLEPMLAELRSRWSTGVKPQ